MSQMGLHIIKMHCYNDKPPEGVIITEHVCIYMHMWNSKRANVQFSFGPWLDWTNMLRISSLVLLCVVSFFPHIILPISRDEYFTSLCVFARCCSAEVEPLNVGPNIATRYARKLMLMRRVRSWLIAPKISKNINIFSRKTFEMNCLFALTVRRVITHPICTPNFFVILSASHFCSSINGSTSVLHTAMTTCKSWGAFIPGTGFLTR